MQIPNIRSRNFTLAEVIHRPSSVSGQNDLYIGAFMMGYLQALRDGLWESTGRETPLVITSGKRSAAYNKQIGASPNSYHNWRLDKDNRIIAAVDLKTSGMPMDNLYTFIKDRTRGETYQHKRLGFVHVAPCGADEEWVQR